MPKDYIFAGLLVPIFEARVISLFTEGMSSCCDSFALNLRIQDWYITSDTLAQVLECLVCRSGFI